MQNTYNKYNPLKCFFAFEGYNSQGLGLNRLKRDYPDFDWVCVGRSEIDVNAIKAANALFPEAADKNYGSITDIDWASVPDFDLFTYSFPCTDISNAGKQLGFSEGSETRSSLLWECEKAIIAKRPQYLLMENVKALVQAKFIPDFRRWIELLESYGYANFWQVINSKDMGVAQNRERVFMVSILRTDADPYPTYNFPKGFPLDKCVEDYMVAAEGIGEGYFIDQERVTNKVLSDILDQPNVRAEMEKLYHEEWKERFNLQEAKTEEIIFVSAEWIRYEEGCGNLANHFDVFNVLFERNGRQFNREIRVDVWYHSKDMWRKDISDSSPQDINFDNYEEFENEIYNLLAKRYPSAD